MGISKGLQMGEYASFIGTHIGDLRNREVLIVGDIGLDEYVHGQVRRISPEAPVPIVEVDFEESRLGLASNVAQNITSLGGLPKLVGVVGHDSTAEQLRQLLARAGVAPEYLVSDQSRPTTRKQRVMVQNHHIVRVDFEQRKFIDREIEDKIISQVKRLVPKVVAVIVQDYAKGVVTERLVQEIVKLARAHGKKVLVDPNRTTPVETYRGANLMTPNYDESIALSAIPDNDLRKNEGLIEKRGRKLMEVIGAGQMVITLGKDGMRVFNKDSSVQFPTNAKQVFDVTGAGDTVIAALALAWGSGFTLEQSCAFANLAAGVVVAKIGCVPCFASEVLNAIHAQQGDSM